jgi:hypothetical protein
MSIIVKNEVNEEMFGKVGEQQLAAQYHCRID